jgi:hypothetical protein
MSVDSIVGYFSVSDRHLSRAQNAMGATLEVDLGGNVGDPLCLHECYPSSVGSVEVL